MWMSHFAPALVASQIVKGADAGLLALAGSLPDALFFVFAMLGVETIKYSDKSESKGYVNFTGGKGSSCFPYDCDNALSHSVVGMAVISVAFAALSTFYLNKAKPSISIMLAYLLVGLTHIPMDLLTHRHDVAITPSEPIRERHGFPMFDYPIAAFSVDLGIFLACLGFHYRTNALSKRNLQVYVIAAALATFIQADFAFLGAPTRAARSFHAPLFLSQILGIAWGIGYLDTKAKAVPLGYGSQGQGKKVQ